MKVALIGNMNNNNFAIMRYLRDLGVDAHLILMKNDISKSQSHFIPENDTWDIEKWNSYIHYLDYYDTHAALFYPGFILKKDFEVYDIYIGSGLVPIIIDKCGLTVDIFYPYGTGIEGVGDRFAREGFKELSYTKRILYKYLRIKKINAIKKAIVCVTSELSYTKQAFDTISVPFKRISIPMVYNKEDVIYSKVNKDLLNIKNKIDSFKHKLFCHVSQLSIKNNIPMLEGFAKFVQSRTNNDSVLVLIEYGNKNSINATKLKLEELGVSNKIIWLTKKSRKEIIYLLDSIDFGFSEFEGITWGGTGWEFLSKGVPFFHYYNISAEKYEKEYGVPMPPFINTNSADEICKTLISYTENSEPYRKVGEEMKIWFDKYGGIGLAKRWKDLIIEIFEAKQNNEIA